MALRLMNRLSKKRSLSSITIFFIMPPGLLFTWLSLVVSFMASFVLSFFPLDVLDGIWDLIESVSEGFLTYSCCKC